MIPTKIYLNPKTLAKVTPDNGDGHTMRVKAFPSKDDAAYTNIDALWHGRDEEPINAVISCGGLLAEFVFPDGKVEYHTIKDKHPAIFEELTRWAYIADIKPSIKEAR